MRVIDSGATTRPLPLCAAAASLTAFFACRAPAPSQALEPASGPASQRRELGPVVDMDIGDARSCAVHESGAVSCRGGGRAPAIIPGLGDAIEVAARDDRPCALTAAGEVWCWWYESVAPPSRLDDRKDALHIAAARWNVALYVVRRGGSVTRHPLEGPPTRIPGIVDAVALAAGHSLVCLLDARGGVSCVDEALGETGAPGPIPGAEGLVQVAVGADELCGLTSTGEARCWKAAVDGREWTPSPIPTLAPVRRVAAGAGFACGLRDGVACWGRVAWPLSGAMIPGLSTATELFAGPHQLCARTEDGALWCLGDDREGQIGDGRRPSVRGVTKWPGVPTIAAARDVTCVAVEDGALHCWGTAETWALPVEVGRVAGAAATVASEAAICALTGTSVRCRGLPHIDPAGTLVADATWRPLPTSADVIDVDLRGSTVCALRRSGEVECWDLAAAATPSRSIGRMEGAVSLHLATEGQVAYGLTETGAVRCLGQPRDCAPSEALRRVAALAAGASHLCALSHLGVVQCVGEWRAGQLGGAPRHPGEAVTVEGRYRAIDAFADRTCGVRDPEGDVHCWGRATGHPSTRIAGFGGPAVDVAVGGSHVCVTHQDGTVECSGANVSGEVGNGQAAFVPRPRVMTWPSE